MSEVSPSKDISFLIIDSPSQTMKLTKEHLPGKQMVGGLKRKRLGEMPSLH
jgi:hypothetical protein